MPKKRRKTQDKPGQGALQPGLYLVATPIGHAQDITLRALEVLRGADVLFCEDTRRLQKLLTIHGIRGKKLHAAHAHNEQVSAALIADNIREGKSVAYASDAGLPLISDPGAAMVNYLTREGLAITSVPGANAALTGLQLAGLPALPFYFAGFLPPKSSARKRTLQTLKKLDATLVFYEAPHRVLETLEDLREVFGNREAAVCRELTKMHEEVLRGKFEALAQNLKNRAAIKGEMVLVVSGAGAEEDEVIDQSEIDRLLLEARKTLSAKDAAAIMSGRTGLPKRELYQRLLHLHDEGSAKRK